MKKLKILAISVNEYFDSEIGKPVSVKSLHGMFINKTLGGKSQIFDDMIRDSLRGSTPKPFRVSEGKHNKYKIGTTAVGDFGKKKYFLFALTKTNANYVAYTTPDLILTGLCSCGKKFVVIVMANK